MNAHKLLFAAVLSACSFSALAQWQWMDETGRKVFSDRPPPAHITPKQILQQPPGAATAAPAPRQKALYPAADGSAPMPAPAAPAAAAAPQPERPATPSKEEAEASAHDKAVEEAQRKAAEAERKKQEAQQAQARQENCQRARAAQASLQSGSLVAYVNEKGERGIMTEERRQADLQRSQKIIKDNCK